MGFQFLLLVGLGGAIGSIGRASVSLLLQSFSPWPTVLVNLVGAFLIGFLVRAMEGLSEPYFFRAFWILGVCGGFTTFSAFGLDLVNLMKEEGFLSSFTYIALSILGTILGVFLGFRTFSALNG